MIISAAKWQAGATFITFALSLLQLTSGLIENYYDMQGLGQLLNIAALALIPVSWVRNYKLVTCLSLN